MDYKARDPLATPRGRGFIIHNAHAYHATSDIYPDWSVWVVAKETRNVNKTVHGSFNCDSDKELSAELADFDYWG